MIGYGNPLRTSPQSQLSGHSSHASQFLATPTAGHAHQQRGESTYSRDEDENLSLTSSEASESGKFSSFGSSSERQSAKASSRRPSSTSSQPNNHASFGSHDLPLRSRDPSLDEPLPPPPPSSSSGGGDPPGRNPPGGWDPPQVGQSDPEDYTHRVRYPNNSRILVPPLLDEEISLRGGSTAGGGSSTVGVPKFRDQGVVGGALKSRDPGEDDEVREKRPVHKAAATTTGSKDSFYFDRSHFDYQVPRYPDQQKTQSKDRPLTGFTVF